MTTSTPTRLSAALVDRYRLARQLGEGGMATVYLADRRVPPINAFLDKTLGPVNRR